MQFSRTRYVTICQQFLVTAVVLAMGLSAAGVLTLKIVAPESLPAGAPNGAPNGAPQPPAPDFESAVHRSDETYVDTAPVEPEVREVPVKGVDPKVRDEVPAIEEQAREEAKQKADEEDTDDAPQAQDEDAERRSAEASAPKVAVLTEPQRVRGFATVGVTWNHGVEVAEDELDIAVRTRSGDGDWSEWAPLEYHAEHAPDEGSGDNVEKARPGTDPLIVGDVDEVQMKAESADGTAPAGMRLAVIDPGKGNLTEEGPAIDTAAIPESEKDARDAPIEKTESSSAVGSALAEADLDLSAMKVAPKPTIYSRAQWGADERIRERGNPSYGTIQTAFVHHTVNANNYTRADVPKIIRSIYAYHVLSRGWRDIGYNFLVDRFGRIWEGRYGGVARPVVGAHTSGFNEVSFAASAIGNFEQVHPTQAVVDAYAKLYAWKLSLYDIKSAQVSVKVKGRTLNRINGHRDVGATACPGRYLYAKIRDIRVDSRNLQRAAQKTGSTGGDTGGSTGGESKPVGNLHPRPDMPHPLTKPLAAVSQPKVNLPIRTSLARSAWPDVVTLDKAGNVRVIPTNGLVRFTKRTETPGAWAKMTQLASVGDVTGDGHGDMLGRYRHNGITRVYRGDGKGGVTTVGIRPTQAFRWANQIIGGGDWNGDGHNDVLTREWPDLTLAIRLGKGNGQFGAKRELARNWRFNHTAVVQDFDGDGRPDVIVQDPKDNRLLLYRGTGKLQLGKALAKPTLIAKIGRVSGLGGWGNLTGGAQSDLFVRMRTGESYIYSGNGKGGIADTYGPYDNLNGIDRLSMSPMASIRRGDVVGRTAKGNLVVVSNNGLTNMGRKLTNKLRVPEADTVFNVGDWDGDGRDDIMTREKDGTRLVLRRGRGDGTFAKGIDFGFGWGRVTNLTGAGDVTGDGKPDLVGSVDGGPMRVWPGNGNKGMARAHWAPARLETYHQIGDRPWITTDPAPVYQSTEKTFVPAAGSSLSAARSNARALGDQYDLLAGLGDANGDRRADVLVRLKSDGKLYLLPGKASGGFGARMWVANGFADYRSIG